MQCNAYKMTSISYILERGGGGTGGLESQKET